MSTLALSRSEDPTPARRRTAASWGRFPLAAQESVLLRGSTPALPEGDARPLLPYGNGRSYGDTCLNDGGILLDCRGMDRILAFHADTGVIRAEAGVLLSDIIATALPAGWFLPVTPGTRFVTLGGAIANDVHGKNHHVAGTFGEHVRRFELLRSDGTRRICSPGENADWMRATIGGMGLTGVVTWAEIQLRRVSGGLVDQSTIKLANLDDYFAIADESDAAFEYTVAWIDSLAGGANLGRGRLMRANHAAAAGGRTVRTAEPWLTVPFTPPFAALNRLSLRVFNGVLYAKQRRREVRGDVPLLKFFYPLDGVGRWNRLYGPRGLLQHQSVIPNPVARDAVADLLKTSQRAGSGSFLTVLKRFGDRPAAGILSFPRGGVTLTLDFANRGAKTEALLAELDRITMAAGGRVNPYKDGRMSAATYAGSFPDWRDILPFKDPRFSSSFWRRVTG
ncbi:MAG: FAD-binding oxidoreductase [Bauldia sp.]|nr:FAD-binding oxidoreductase [Bauldia sp.]